MVLIMMNSMYLKKYMKILKRKQLKEENLNLINGINYSMSIKNNIQQKQNN